MLRLLIIITIFVVIIIISIIILFSATREDSRSSHGNHESEKSFGPIVTKLRRKVFEMCRCAFGIKNVQIGHRFHGNHESWNIFFIRL